MSDRPQHVQADSFVGSLAPEVAWKQVLSRDTAATFLYAVTTTGVFCRPSCKSRRPLRTNVRFFCSGEEARTAGFRPCKLCRPEALPQGNALEKIRAHIESNLDRPVPLAELGLLVGLSPFTVQRFFKQELGVSPLQYQRALRAGLLRGALKEGETVTNAIYNAGFGSSSRGYEGAQLGMTPACFAKGGRGEQIDFTSEKTPFGWMVVGATKRGLCWLALAGTKAEAETTLREEFPLATLKRDPSLAGMVDAALRPVVGPTNSSEALVPPQAVSHPSRKNKNAARVGHPESRVKYTEQLDLRGTEFQLRVWQALRQIPRGETRSYSQLAREMGEPKATRAVARACAMNRVALVVPCHRVVGVSGALTGYRWGVERKRMLLEAESRKG